MVHLAHIEMQEPGKIKLNGKRLEELLFGDRSGPDQDFSDASAFGRLEVHGLKQFGFGQAEFVFEYSA
jgi:hypothetical protein